MLPTRSKKNKTLILVAGVFILVGVAFLGLPQSTVKLPDSLQVGNQNGVPMVSLKQATETAVPGQKNDATTTGKDASGKDASGKDASGKDASGKDASGKDAAAADAATTPEQKQQLEEAKKKMESEKLTPEQIKANKAEKQQKEEAEKQRQIEADKVAEAEKEAQREAVRIQEAKVKVEEANDPEVQRQHAKQKEADQKVKAKPSQKEKEAQKSHYSYDPKHQITYPEINLDADINENLKVLGIRALDANELFPPPRREVEYTSSLDLNSYMGTMLHEDWIYDRPEKLICPEAMFVPNGKDELIDITSPVEMKDPRIQKDMEKYLYQTGLKLFASTEDMNQWYRFSGSAAWMPAENAYFVVTRWFYGPNENHDPILSVSRLQLYDANWKEIYDKRLRFLDVTPDDVRNALARYVAAEDDEERERVLDLISLRMPSFMHVEMPINEEKNVMGAEDPKVAQRPSKSGGEPIIMFNMRTNGDIRRMFAGLPLRKRKNGIYTKCKWLKFYLSDEEPKAEKNWVPFFEEDDYKTGGLGSMHILYSYDPLVIAKCDLENDRCDTVQREEPSEKIPDQWQVHDRSYIRGATNLVPFPKSVQNKLKPGESSDLKLWFGFAKTHVERCGCGDAFYRPLMSVLAKQNGKWSVMLLSENTDFDIEVLEWEHRNTYCSSRPNVLSPNSIPQWNLMEDGSDQMDLTLSEADSIDLRLTIKGIAHYVEDAFKQEPFKDKMTYAEHRGRMLSNCLVNNAYRYCVIYANHHQPPE